MLLRFALLVWYFKLIHFQPKPILKRDQFIPNNDYHPPPSLHKKPIKSALLKCPGLVCYVQAAF